MSSSPDVSAATIGFDRALANPGFAQDPHGVLAQLQRYAPIFHSEALGAWIVSRFEDVDAVLRDSQRLSKKTMARLMGLLPEHTRARTRPLIDLLVGNMISQQDAPEHTRLRRIASSAFSPHQLDRLRGVALSVTDEVLDRCMAAGSMDVVADLARPLAYRVMCELLGVSADDGERFGEWAEAVGGFLIAPHAGEAQVDRGVQAFDDMKVYVEEQIAARRRDPSSHDVISMLAAAQEAEGLTEDEIVTTCVQLVFAGGSTTSSLIANAALALAEHRDQYARLQERPELVAQAVEETLRYEPPIMFVARLSTHDLTFNNTTIPRDETVLACIGAANRDPAVFKDPDTFDIERAMDRHLAFGIGAHFCLGARLARLEAEIALSEIARRHASLVLSGPDILWKPGFVARELESLCVSL